MQLENIYPKFFAIRIDAVIAEEIEMDLLTPKQLKMLYLNCKRHQTSFDNISEKRYAIIGEKEYERKERKYDEVEKLISFLDEEFVEALV